MRNSSNGNINFSLIFFSFALVATIAASLLSACGGGGGGAAPAATTSTTTTTTGGTGTTTVADATAPICTASVGAGYYSSAQSVSVSCDETATVYYTVDGSVPVAAKPSGKEVSFSFVSMDESGRSSLVRGFQSRTVYSSAIAVSSSLTLKFFGKDAAGNAQTVQSIDYIIDTTAPTAAITNNSGKTVFKNGDTSLFTIAFSEAPVDNATAPSISSVCTGTATGITSVAVNATSTIVFGYSFTAGTGDGTCTISVVGADTAGNAVASVSGNTYTVDNTGPGAPVATTLDGTFLGVLGNNSPNAQSFTTGGTCSSDTAVIKINGSTTGVTYTAGATTWSYAGTLAIASTWYPFTVSAEDAAGNSTTGTAFNLAF